MKKSLKLCLAITLLLVFGMTAKVYAETLNDSVQLNTSKFEYSQDEEIIVEVKLTNHTSDNGINSIEGILEYDKTNLEFVEMQGVNGWATPTYNTNNGRFVSDRNGYSEESEIMFKIVFKAKVANADDVTIKLKDIKTFSDGTAHTAPGIVRTLIIKTDNPTEDPDGPVLPVPVENELDEPTPLMNSNENPGKDMPINNTVPTEEDLPETGLDNLSLIIAGVALVAVAIFSGVEARKIKEY